MIDFSDGRCGFSIGIGLVNHPGDILLVFGQFYGKEIDEIERRFSSRQDSPWRNSTNSALGVSVVFRFVAIGTRRQIENHSVELDTRKTSTIFFYFDRIASRRRNDTSQRIVAQAIEDVFDYQ